MRRTTTLGGSPAAPGLDVDLEQLRSEDRKRHYEVLPSEIAEIFPSDQATPTWLYERIHGFYQTGMGYHIVSLQSKQGKRYVCLTYSPEFIRLPDSIEFHDIIGVERLGRDVSKFDCGDAQRWACNYSV